MTINIVIGPTLSGKTHFIKHKFPNSKILSIGEYQRRLLCEVNKKNIECDYEDIILKANLHIKNDILEMLSKGKNIIIEHTLFKAQYRINCIEDIRSITDEPIDIYLLQFSDKQLKNNIANSKEKNKLTLEEIKHIMRQIETPVIDEGFEHVYVVNDQGVQDWSNKPYEKKFINKDTDLSFGNKINSIDIGEKCSIFRNKPFIHICESCGKVEILTSKDAYELGWDYPGDGGIYKTNMFGILSPRTCGDCEIDKTAYWAIVVEGKSIEELSENQVQAIERIMREPDNLKVY